VCVRARVHARARACMLVFIIHVYTRTHTRTYARARSLSDANGNGEVDLDEFRAMVRASALAKDSLWWRLGLMKIFQRLFLEPLSFITSVMTRGAEKAYTHWYLNWSPRARREKRIAASVFVEADVNKDGAVSYDELEARVGKRIEEKELRTLFDGADRDRNGALDKREFRSSQSLRSRLASIFT